MALSFDPSTPIPAAAPADKSQSFFSKAASTIKGIFTPAPKQAPTLTFDPATPVKAPVLAPVKPLTFAPEAPIKAPAPAKSLTFDPLVTAPGQPKVRTQDFKDVVNVIPTLVGGALQQAGDIGSSALKASNDLLGTKFPTTTHIPNIFQDDIHGGKNAYESHTLQDSYATRIKNGDSPAKALMKTALEGGMDIALAKPFSESFLNLTGEGIKNVLKSTVPEKLITPEMVSASRQQIRDFASGADTYKGQPSPLPEVIQQAFKDATPEGKVHMVQGSGVDIITAKPSAVGKLFGISQDEADSLLQKLHGTNEAGVREGSAGALPGDRPINPRFAGMSAGMSTEAVERVGGAYPDGEIPKELQPLAEEAKKYKSAEEFVKAQDKIGRARYKVAATKMREASDIGDNVKFKEAQIEMTNANKLFRGQDTKSQLTDIWNKANEASKPVAETATKELDPKTQKKVAELENQLSRVSQSLRAYEANPAAHIKAYGEDRKPLYQNKIAELQGRIEKFAEPSKQDGIRERQAQEESAFLKRQGGEKALLEKANKERNKILKKRAEESNPRTKVEKDIKKSEAALRDKYLSAGKIKDGSEFYKADEIFSQVETDLKESRPGQRVFTGYGNDRKVEGVSSTFPKWVPEPLRNMDLFESVLPGFDARKITYPHGKRQIELFNAMLNEVDRRLGLDTSPERRDISQTVSNLSVEKLAERDERSANRLLEKGAKQTDKHIADRDRKEALKKAELETQERLKAEEKARTTLQEKINALKKTKIPSKSFLRTLYETLKPLKGLDAKTKEIITDWVAQKEVAKTEAEKTYRDLRTKGPQNMEEVNAYEAGKNTPYIRKFEDDLYTRAKREGMDIGYTGDHLQHIYLNPEQSTRAVTSYLKAKGLSDLEIQAYIDGEKLPEDKSLRLKLSPNFVKERVFPSYSAAAKYGLIPKYRQPAQIMAESQRQLDTAIANRDLIDKLKSEVKLLPDSDAPDHFVPVSRTFAKLGYGEALYAEPSLAKLINGIFRDEKSLGVGPRIAKASAGIARFVQHSVLGGGGIPFTDIHLMSSAKTIQSLHTALGELATLQIPEMMTSLRQVFALLRANSNSLSVKWFESKLPIIERMAQDGFDLSSRVGNYQRLGASVRDVISSELKVIDKDKSLAGNIKEVAKGVSHIIGMTFDKVYTEKTFGSLMQQRAVILYEDTYNAGRDRGLSDKEAGDLATKTLTAFEGLEPDLQGKTTKDSMASLFIAPQYRQGIMTIFAHTAEALNSIGDGGIKDPGLSKNRSFFLGSILMFALYQLLNKKLNGHYTWQNNPGRETALRIPTADGGATYIEFLPSLLTIPRNLISGALALYNGDFKTATQKGMSVSSIPIQLFTEAMTNKDYFGRQIYGVNDSTATIYKKQFDHMFLGSAPPFIGEAQKYLAGQESLWAAFNYSTGSLLKVSSPTQEQNAVYYAKTTEETKTRATATQGVQTIYDSLQKMKANGETVKADEIYYALPPDQKAIYDKIKVSVKAKATLGRKPAISSIYDSNQSLIQQGRQAEADKIYWGLSPQDRKIYNAVKKASQTSGLPSDFPTTPTIPSGTKTSSASIISRVLIYAKAVGTDPASAFHDIFSGQSIKSVENGQILVDRMSYADSSQNKKDLSAGPGMILDHIVPLEAGGTNDKSNLQLVTAAEDGTSENQPVEDYLGKALKAGKITGAQAREAAVRYKAGTGQPMTTELLKEYKDKYKSQPMSAQDVYDSKF